MSAKQDKREADSISSTSSSEQRKIKRCRASSLDDTGHSTLRHNVAPPSQVVSLSSPGARINTTAQLANYNNLLRTRSSPSSAAASITISPNPVQKISIDTILQDEEEQSRIRWLTTRVIEEFAVDAFKTSDKIAEAVLLGPFLDQEDHRKLVNCMLADFESAKLLDVELLQGMVQLVECAGPDYLVPDDLVHIIVVLYTRLQETYQQSTKHSYSLTLALSRLLDIMVEGKVQDLSRVMDQEPLLALLGQLATNSDPYLKYQAAYAQQALLHIPNDETRRQFMLRQTGSITMGLLGVSSVCKLDLGNFMDRVDNLYKAAGHIREVVTEVVDGAQSLLESGQDITSNEKRGILPGGRRLWYSALREVQEHVFNGRLADFNTLILEAPCHQEVEFQWGVCQLLGKIAVDTQWDVATRQHAVDLLGELYRCDSTWTTNEEVHSWILQTIHQVASLSDPHITEHSQSILHSLEKEGDVAKQTLYRAVLAAPLEPYPLQTRLPLPQSSTLLARAQAVLDVDLDLHRLRTQRLESHNRTVYIPPQAKPTAHSSDDTLFPLMERALEFLESDRQVLLLLGESGAGKSMFNLELEHTLWTNYKSGGSIPLFINLPFIEDPAQDLITKQLQYHDFLEEQIQELKQHREFIVICDGYDESQLKVNIHATNEFHNPGHWKIKMVISCRSQYLGTDYRSRFRPQPANHYDRATSELMLEAVIAPFSRQQIEQYVEQYGKNLSMYAFIQHRPAWTKEEYMERLTRIPKLMELVSNPFLLTLSLQALPEIIGSRKDFAAIHITRVQLYDGFVKQWLEVNKRRLEGSRLSDKERSEFYLLLDDGFDYHGIRFQKDLAAAIFKEQEGQPVVDYTHFRDKTSWKSSFFGTDDHTKLLRESSTLTRSGTFHQFIHRSLQEYFYSRTVYDPLDYDPDSDRPPTADPKVALSQRSFVSEPSVLQFLAERVEMDTPFKVQLLSAIEDSKVNSKAGVAAANAISILVKAAERFNGADLRGIKIPGADLCGGEFDSADLEGADLSNVNLAKTWLRQADLSKAQMEGVQFGELPYIQFDDEVASVAFSSDGECLAVCLIDGTINIHNTTTWRKVVSYLHVGIIAASPVSRELARGGLEHTVELGDILTGEPRLVLRGHENMITCICYSLNGALIATASKDTTVQIWSTVSGKALHILSGHSESATGVTFSPDGLQLVSCGEDKTVRTWDIQTGRSLAVLEWHEIDVLCVAYSPDGRQFASGDSNGTIGLWNACIGKIARKLDGFHEPVYCMAYSPEGHQIIYGAEQGTIRVCDSHSGELLGTLSGHVGPATSIAYSPSGDYIVSGSGDESVRFWKAGGSVSEEFSGGSRVNWSCIALSPNCEQTVTGGRNGEMQLWETLTGKPGAVLEGHTALVGGLAFSPCGERIASSSKDGTVRQWCVQTGTTLNVFNNLSGFTFGVAYSPSGHQIIATDDNDTVRLWNSLTGELGLVLKGHTDCINNVKYSPSGHQIATCSEDETVRLWDASTGEQLFALKHPESVNQVIYSSDGLELISVAFACDIPRFWDSQSGELVDRGDMSGLGILSCHYSPNGKLLATGGGGGLLRLFEYMLGFRVEVFQSMVGVATEIQLGHSSEHMYLTTLGFGHIRVWQLKKKGHSFDLRMLWSLGEKELFLSNANFCDAVGLSSVDLELIKQRDATTGSNNDSVSQSPKKE